MKTPCTYIATALYYIVIVPTACLLGAKKHTKHFAAKVIYGGMIATLLGYVIDLAKTPTELMVTKDMSLDDYINDFVKEKIKTAPTIHLDELEADDTDKIITYTNNDLENYFNMK